MKIQDYPIEFRPREKAMRLGLQSLSHQELLCLLLGSGTRQATVYDLADQILKQSDQLSTLLDLQPEQLQEISGIGPAKALTLCAALELARRALHARMELPKICRIEDARDWFCAQYGTCKQEHFAALFLDAKGSVIRHRLLFIGTLNESLIHPRDVIREAVLANAHSVIFVHNHPSGDCTPSPADLQSTRMLLDAAHLCGIEVTDHLIVSASEFFSFARHGLLG